MIDDYVVAASAAVMVAAVVILAGFLFRYRTLIQEADRSSRLAKDVWDSASSRFSVMDARLIDLMARTEVLSARLGVSQTSPRVSALTPSSVPSVPVGAKPQGSALSSRAKDVITPVQFGSEGNETENVVLKLLAEGPKSSAEIKREIGRSREHTARLMKGLFDRGLVIRNDRNRPYVYEVTEAGRSHLTS